MDTESEFRWAYENFIRWKNLLAQIRTNLVTRRKDFSFSSKSNLDLEKEEKVEPFVERKASEAHEKCLDLIMQMMEEEKFKND